MTTTSTGPTTTIVTDTESWGPLAALETVDGVGTALIRFPDRAALDAYVAAVAA